MKLIKKMSIMLLVMCISLGQINVVYAKTDQEVLNERVNVLSELKILKGNGVSLDLEGELSRAQAATFIVRLLSKESYVEENKLKYSITDFKDVSKDQWYASYVGYCVEQGIIDGYTDKTFRPNDKLGEKAFLKLILTALGHKYNDDFYWTNVFEYAYGVGLVKDTSYAGTYVEDTKYTRSDVVQVIYTALQMIHKVDKVRMIQRLIDDHVITKDQAKEYGLVEDDLQTDILSVTPTSDTTIEIKFNEKVQMFSEDGILVYESDGSSTVLPVDSITKQDSTDTFTIVTAEKQKTDQTYTILLDKVVDSKGNPTSFSREFLGFRADEVVSDFFKISKVEAISNNVIYVYYTHPINDNALQPGFYNIEKDGEEIVKGSDMLISKLPTSNNGVSIYLKNYTFESEEYYKVRIDGKLSSSYVVQLNDGEGDAVKFKSVTEDNTPLTVDSCLPINSTTIQITFNKVINPTIAKQVYQYALTDTNNIAIRVSKAVVMSEGDSAGKMVRLTIDSSIKVNKEYKLMVNYMTDVTRQFSIIEKEFTFFGSYYSVDDIQIEAVLPIDETLVLLYLNRAVDQDAAMDISNYQIHGISDSNFISIPVAAYYDKQEDSQTIRIYLSQNNKLKAGNSYRFKVLQSLKDEMGNIQSTIKTKQFTHSSSSATDVIISEAKVVGENTIRLSFNKEVARHIDNIDLSNYTLTYTDNGVNYPKTPIGANYIDPTTIILKFDILDLEKKYKITYKKLIDYGNNVTINQNGKNVTDVEIGE